MGIFALLIGVTAFLTLYATRDHDEDGEGPVL